MGSPPPPRPNPPNLPTRPDDGRRKLVELGGSGEFHALLTLRSSWTPSTAGFKLNQSLTKSHPIGIPNFHITSRPSALG